MHLTRLTFWRDIQSRQEFATYRGGNTGKIKVHENSIFDMESLLGIIMSVCAKFWRKKLPTSPRIGSPKSTFLKFRHASDDIGVLIRILHQFKPHTLPIHYIGHILFISTVIITICINVNILQASFISFLHLLTHSLVSPETPQK